MKRTILKLDNLTKEYGKGDGKTIALNHITLDIDEGEFLVVLGSSGSGKSTLLNMIGAMDLPTSGDVLFEDLSIVSMNKKKRCEYRRNHVGFIFQNFNLITDLTALENVLMTASFSKNKDAKAELIRVGLEDKLNSYPKELSGGQQQRVSIARALVKDSKILLCDEPTGALDSESEKVILKLLLDIKTKYHKTIILVTHKQEISELADRVLIMKNGSIIEDKINEMPKTLEEIIW